MNAANLFDHAFKYRQDLINITERCNKIDIINRFGDDVSVIATTLKLLQFDITTETGIEWREEVVDIFEYLITPVLEHIDINTDEFKQALHDQLLNRNNPISLTIMTRLFDYIKSLNTNNLTIDKILVTTLIMSLITNIPEDSNDSFVNVVFMPDITRFNQTVNDLVPVEKKYISLLELIRILPFHTYNQVDHTYDYKLANVVILFVCVHTLLSILQHDDTLDEELDHLKSRLIATLNR